MNIPAKRPATYDDLFELPENVVGEILAGELVTHPRPGPRHTLAASLIGAMLVDHFDRTSVNGPGGWWILFEPECHLGPDIVVPDIAGWRQSTMQTLPDTAWFDVAPDWVCEIISPSTHQHDRSIKRDLYARERVLHYWIVDPIERLIEVFERLDDRWVLLTTVRDDMDVSLAPFEEMPFPVSRLWV